MDTEELIKRCRVMTYIRRRGEQSIRPNEEKIVVGCLIEQVRTNRSVNKEGLKITIQQA